MAIKDILSDPNREFTQMGLYNIRLNDLQQERDMALSDENLNKFYFLTLALLMNVEGNFRRKNVSAVAIDKLKEDVFKLGVKIRSLLNQNEKTRELNKFMIIEELVNYNMELTNKMHETNMIFPEKIVRDPGKASRLGMFGGEDA